MPDSRTANPAAPSAGTPSTKRTASLRFQLALTYAGIALLTAALLGGILLAVLGNYYARSEQAYLQAAASRLVADPPIADDAAALQRWAQIGALGTQTRVRVYDANGNQVADSGPPQGVDPGALLIEGRPERGGHGRGDLPSPLGGGIFGGGGAQERSNRKLQLALSNGGFVTLSEAPASGRDALVSVAQAWTVAALLAVALAALAGYLLSSRVSHPVAELTEAADRMHDGDLSARATVVREDEVGRLAESFNAMAGRIETTVVALRRFVADAAHEIGTPLTALQADLELAEQEARSDDERRLVQRALGQAHRLEALSTDLLRLSRIEAGESPGEITLVDVATLVREEADAAASRAEQAGLVLDLDVADEVLVVAADRSQLQVVVDNLLDNAVKFTPEGGRVSLTARGAGNFAFITVADTGVGIPAEEHGQVFGRFHRARNVAAYPGSGLGLAIVRATVERFGGSVDFDSSEIGTRFTVRLPLA
jgi:two-component system sensor histidine kinase BaeS